MRSPGKDLSPWAATTDPWAAPYGLGGWPLPTMADGDALHIARTKASSAVGFVRRHLKTCWASRRLAASGQPAQPVFRCALEAPKAGGPSKNLQPLKETELLEFGLGAGFHQLLDGGFGVSLGNAFLDVLRSAVHQILGFLEAQAGDFAHSLDDGHLVGAGFEQH